MATPKLLPDTLQMPSLGRPFQLGMLYDCRNEHLIPGVTLWNQSTLKKALDSKPHVESQQLVIAEDTIESKTSSLGVGASLKLSVLGGLVNVSGSAKFLNDKRTSEQQARVTLKYSMTSHFEQLTMSHLAVDKVEHPDVFDKGNATHVVTAVVYGAEAFFVFDREISSNEKYHNVHGHMEAMIRKLPAITIGGDGQLDMKDIEKGEVERFLCQFHGDIVLPENPTTFQEAVKIYKELPQLVSSDGNSSKVVPKVVWLYPLCKLDSRAAHLVREISIGFVTQTQKLIQDLHDLLMRANDLKKSEVYTNFQGIQEQLSQFTDMTSEYETDIAKKVSTILPQVRGGGADEVKLAEVFKQSHASPFDYHSLSSWLRAKEEEEKVLKNYLSSLKCDSILFAFSPGELNAIITDLDINHTLCFAFKVAGTYDPFLEQMLKYLRSSETSQEYTKTKPKHWYQDMTLTNDIKSKARIFKSFAQANGSSESTKFVVSDISEQEDCRVKGADILLYGSGLPESYQPPTKPGKPSAFSITHNSLQLTWSQPQNGAQNVTSYTILYRQEGDDQWEKQESDSESTKLSSLEPETTYFFKVRAHCEVGVSVVSESSDPIKMESFPHRRLAIIFKDLSQCIHSTKGCEVYKVPLDVTVSNEDKGITKCCIYDRQKLSHRCSEKVLMVVGATGSGKSTLINGMANYILGVEWKDDFRFRLIGNEVSQSQVFSQTQSITAYSFPHYEGSSLPYQLTVIDTPGFGDTGGLERDEKITAQIKEFFSLKSNEGIDHVDGIGFVAQSSLMRLTPTQKYIIDSILSVFGRDIADNIFMMITFADGAAPAVMDAVKTHIREAKPPIPLMVDNLKYFKFNNSAFFSKPSNLKTTGIQSFDEMFWQVGYTSFCDFFHHLGMAEPKTLSLTRSVLEEREKLQSLIQGVQMDIHRGMTDIDRMRAEKQVVETNEALIQAHKDFTYQVPEDHLKQEKLPLGIYVTNCLKCNRTCHYTCKIAKNEDKRNCTAMDSKGYCEICPAHCYWSPNHVNNEVQYVIEQVMVTKRYADLEKKYREGQKGKATAESMILKIKENVTKTFNKVCNDISKAQKCLQRLETIALKPNPLTEVQYIDLLISSEKDEAKTGWEKRVKCLEKAREMATIMADAKKGELKPSMNLEALMDDLLKDTTIGEKSKPLHWLPRLFGH